MDTRIKKFITISALFFIVAYWAALKLDTFATGLVAFIAISYFIATGLKSVFQLIKRQEVRTNLIMGIGGIIGVVVMLGSFAVSDHGLRDLTIQRRQTFNELRPTLLKYKGERGFFPCKLQDLVPDYLQAVPPELLNDGKEDIYKKITYEVCKGEASFIFSQARGPDSRVTYHVSENRYEYDQ